MIAKSTREKLIELGGKVMKRIAATASVVVLVGALSGSAFAVEPLLKEEAADGYCHMKFPAVRQRTLSSDNPQVKSDATGDVIDLYGDCNETPTSNDQIVQQKRDEQFMFGRNYEDGD
jgi:hypothetical protein